MPSTVMQRSKFKWVTWLLVSKAFAKTCTLQRSGESEGSKTCSTAPARWQHPWKCHGSFLWRSSAPQCRSRAGQLPTPGHPIALWSNHPKKWLHFYWNDLMILFHPFSIFTLYMLSLVFDLLHKQGAAMNWTTLFLDMSRSQASSCLQ